MNRKLCTITGIVLWGLSAQGTMAGACDNADDLIRMAVQARAYAAGQVYSQDPPIAAADAVESLCAVNGEEASRRAADDEIAPGNKSETRL
jgi:hypothetical protein